VSAPALTHAATDTTLPGPSVPVHQAHPCETAAPHHARLHPPTRPTHSTPPAPPAPCPPSRPAGPLTRLHQPHQHPVHRHIGVRRHQDARTRRAGAAAALPLGWRAAAGASGAGAGAGWEGAGAQQEVHDGHEEAALAAPKGAVDEADLRQGAGTGGDMAAALAATDLLCDQSAWGHG
jgi:hypothetical protein